MDFSFTQILKGRPKRIELLSNNLTSLGTNSRIFRERQKYPTSKGKNSQSLECKDCTEAEKYDPWCGESDPPPPKKKTNPGMKPSRTLWGSWVGKSFCPPFLVCRLETPALRSSLCSFFFFLIVFYIFLWYFFLLFIFNWRILVLPCCVCYCHTRMGIRHNYIYISTPSWASHLSSPHYTPLGHYRARS